MTLAPIKQTARHVAEGERHIARQREIVAALKRKGRRWTALRTAQVLLQMVELAQQFHVAAGTGCAPSRRRRMKKGGRSPRSLSPLAQRLHGLPCR